MSAREPHAANPPELVRPERVSVATFIESLAGRDGCIVQRPGDPEPGWWVLVREDELRRVLEVARNGIGY